MESTDNETDFELKPILNLNLYFSSFVTFTAACIQTTDYRKLLPPFPTILVVLVGSFGFLGRWFFASASNKRQLSSGSYTKASNTAIKESLLRRKTSITLSQVRRFVLIKLILISSCPGLYDPGTASSKSLQANNFVCSTKTGECLRMESKILKAAFLRATDADFEATVKG
uniref:Uncharacterized protein n=1 Tax=Glossina pallidipes TaxID=7398 RepID=A0A1A9ZDX8_GLOPL